MVKAPGVQPLKPINPTDWRDTYMIYKKIYIEVYFETYMEIYKQMCITIWKSELKDNYEWEASNQGVSKKLAQGIQKPLHAATFSTTIGVVT